MPLGKPWKIETIILEEIQKMSSTNRVDHKELPWRSCSSGSSSSPSSSPVASSNSPAPWSVVNTSLHCNSHLHYTTIHCTTIYYTTPHYTILLYTTLHFLHYITLQYTRLHLYSTLQCSAAQCTVHYTDPGLELGPLQDAGCHTSLLFLG